MLKHSAIYFCTDLAPALQGLFAKNGCGAVEIHWDRHLFDGYEVDKAGACDVDPNGSAAGYYVIVGTKNPSLVTRMQRALATDPELARFKGKVIPQRIWTGRKVGFTVVQ